MDAWTAAGRVTTNARTRGAMLMGAALETGQIAPPFPDQFGGGPGRGPWQIEAGRGGSHAGEITENDARDTLKAAQFMVASYEAAVRDIGDGDWRADPMHAHAEAVFRAERPAAMYPEERITRAWRLVSDIIAGAAPGPVAGFQFVTPVDADIVQGSDGTFSHGGAHPGFFAIDYGCAFGTEVRCVAEGDVIFNGFNHPREGQTGHTICVQHDGGYESRYCHLSQFGTPVGTHLQQGELFCATGAPDRLTADGKITPGINGFGSGAHLHFSISLNGVWVKVEKLTDDGLMGPFDAMAAAALAAASQEGIPVGDGFDSNEIQRLWFGNKPSAQRDLPIYAFDAGGEVEQTYIAAANGKFAGALGRSVVLGEVLSALEPDPGTQGRSIRYFANGKITRVVRADGDIELRIN